MLNFFAAIFRIPAQLMLLDTVNLDQWQSSHISMSDCMMGVCITVMEFLGAVDRLCEKIELKMEN